MKTFEEMNLPKTLNDALKNMQFNQPTPIQEKTIPLALEGRDILGSAQTGTGKTAAFGIPLVAKLLSEPTGSALVLTPTRELAAQIIKQLRIMLGKNAQNQSTLLIGGEPIFKQLKQLQNRPRLIIGTPGRIYDHLKRASLVLNDTNFLVFDETDRMLDMGFMIQIKNIMQHIKTKPQTLLFSATLNKNTIQIAQQYLNNPVHVDVNAQSKPADNIHQDSLHTSEKEKYFKLIEQLNERTGSVIIFVKTKYNTEKMANKLLKEGHKASAIHGDLKQNKRNQIISSFRQKKYRILVATDVASRGLDIPHIEHVINYDLPQCPEDYIHRIGRTGRAGAQGFALNLITPADRSKWNAIDNLLNPKQNKKSTTLKRPNKRKRPSSSPKANNTSFQKHKKKF